MPVTLETSLSTIRTESEMLRGDITQKRAVFSRGDGDELIRKIARLIKRQTNFGVQEMRVFFENGTVVLAGYCHTFYTKQLAQEAALKLIGDANLENRIRVA